MCGGKGGRGAGKHSGEDLEQQQAMEARKAEEAERIKSKGKPKVFSRFGSTPAALVTRLGGAPATTQASLLGGS